MVQVGDQRSGGRALGADGSQGVRHFRLRPHLALAKPTTAGGPLTPTPPSHTSFPSLGLVPHEVLAISLVVSQILDAAADLRAALGLTFEILALIVCHLPLSSL